MRRSLCIGLVVAALSACAGGGGDGVSPGGNAVPASVVVQAGDNQSADAGTSVMTSPVAKVKNALGQGIPGIAVSFVVTSGGGAVANPSAVTGADGTASAGTWTLGVQAGANTLEARVAALSPVTFHAQGVATALTVADSVIGSGGATLRFAAPGSPWDGTDLVIPAGSFAAPGRWTFRIDPSVMPPPLPSGVLVAGPALVVSTEQARAQRLLTLRIPVTRQAGFVSAIIVHDPLRNIIEMLPMLGGDATTVLVGTTHLNASLLIGRGSGASPPFAAAGVTSTGLYRVQIPTGLLAGITSTALRLLDAFPIAEGGSYSYPDGHGPAAGLLTMLAKVVNPNATLGTLFKPVSIPGMHVDSASLAGLVAMARRWDADRTALAPVLNGIGGILGSLSTATRDSLADVNVRASMLLSNLPQLMMFVRSINSAPYPAPDVSFGTAIGATPAGVEYVDPADPLAARSLQQSSGQGFVSRQFQTVRDAAPANAEAVVPLGNSTLFPVQRYLDLAAKVGALDRQQLALEAQLPQLFVEIRNAASLDWMPVLPGGSVVRSDSAELRVRCTACPAADQVATEPQTQETIAVDTASGQVRTRSARFGAFGAPLFPITSLLPPGTLTDVVGAAFAQLTGNAGGPRISTTRRMVAAAAQPVSRVIAPVRASVRRTDMQLSPASQVVQQHGRADAVVARAMAGGTDVFEWKWGDGTAPGTRAPGDTTATHTYHQKGTFMVEATLLQGPLRVARVSGTVVVRDSFTVDPAADSAQVDSVVQFTARPHGDVPAQARYEWDFGDGSLRVTKQNDSLAAHAFAAPGNYTVTVELWDAAAGVRHGVATSLVSVALPGFLQVSTALGGNHTCAIRPGGALWCWGKNTRGQLGDGTTSRSTRPVRVAGGQAFVEVASGTVHTCARTATGVAWCWGDHTFAQRGDGTPYGPQYPAALQPVIVAGAPSFAALSVGAHTTCGRTSAGQLWCWGYNGHTQIGDGTSTNRIAAVGVPIGATVGSVGVGYWQTCAAPVGAASGTYCWGDNGKDANNDFLVDYSPQSWGSNLLGTGSHAQTLYSPGQVVNLGLPWDRVSAGNGFVCALTIAGIASCWGVNGFGQLGDGTTGFSSNPVLVTGGLTFSSIGGGAWHTCGLTTTGEVWCWGRNHFGQLGTGTQVDSPVPVRAAQGIGRVIQISVGSATTCAITEVGDLWCWGLNNEGQVGDGTLITRLSPVKVIP